jgi:hypothetical protein
VIGGQPLDGVIALAIMAGFSGAMYLVAAGRHPAAGHERRPDREPGGGPPGPDRRVQEQDVSRGYRDERLARPPAPGRN